MIFLRSHIATSVVMLLFVIVPYPLYIQSCLIILVIFHSGPYGCYEYGSIRDINVADKDINYMLFSFLVLIVLMLIPQLYTSLLSL